MSLLGDKCISQAAKGTTETYSNLRLSITALLKVPGPFNGKKICSSRITQRVTFRVATETTSTGGWVLLGFRKGMKGNARWGDRRNLGGLVKSEKVRVGLGV